MESKLSIRKGFIKKKVDVGYFTIYLDNPENQIIFNPFDYLDKRNEATQIIIKRGEVLYTFPSFDSLFNHIEKSMKKR
jgi:hypothetical protein